VQTRSESQVRSHAQKHFNKLAYQRDKIGHQPDVSLRKDDEPAMTRSRDNKLKEQTETELQMTPKKKKIKHPAAKDPKTLKGKIILAKNLVEGEGFDLPLIKEVGIAIEETDDKTISFERLGLTMDIRRASTSFRQI
jgi:hypothetical protein